MKLFLSLVGITLYFSAYFIYPTTVNGRFSILNTNNSEFSVLLQINTNSGTDDLGGATIVFNFDTTAIHFPNNPVKDVDYTFHNFCTDNYSTATVTRPMVNQIWVNIDLPFSSNNNGSIVAQNPAWTNVVTIHFAVVDPTGMASLIWLSASPFWGVYDADNITQWETGIFEGNFGLEVQVKDGWNLVSVPGINPDGQGINNWWPGKTPGQNVYKLVGGYNVPVTITAPGEGYWMNHNGANLYNAGDEWPAAGIERVPNVPINVSSGWNTIGGFDKIIQTSQITTTPQGLIIGQIYTYIEPYQVANSLKPGRGYIVKLSGPGQINFNGTILKADGNELEYYKDNWGKLIFTDNAGKTYSLYLVNDDTDLNLYELPPCPPDGLFDIRFGSGRVAESIENGIQSIIMNGVIYPVKIKVENLNIKLKDESGKIIEADLNSGEEITITNESVKKLLVNSGKQMIPYNYVLIQNYPNPFNPVTKIKFAIPNEAYVNLRIYNVLGELVSTLIDKNLNAGEYEFEFNARNLASGIYIYRIKAGTFVDTKKMILMK